MAAFTHQIALPGGLGGPILNDAIFRRQLRCTLRFRVVILRRPEFLDFSDILVQILIRWFDTHIIRRDLCLKKGVSIRQLWRRQNMQIFFFLGHAIFAEFGHFLQQIRCDFASLWSNPSTTKKAVSRLPLHWRVPWATVIVALWNLPNGWPGPERTDGRKIFNPLLKSFCIFGFFLHFFNFLFKLPIL